MRSRIFFAVALTTALCPGTLLAQSETLSKIIPDLLLEGVRMQSNVAQGVGNPHEAHFTAALGQTSAPYQFNKLLVGQLGTFPLGSSSGGFVFNVDPATGLFKPASQSFGPGFAERALTNGKGRLGFGMTFQHLSYSSYAGVDLRNGDLAYILQHNDCCAVPGNSLPDPLDPAFEGDLVRMSLSIDVNTNVTAPFVSYGITNRWDVGLVVPIVQVDLSPTVTSTIDRIATGSNVLIHSWDGLGSTTQVKSLSGSASGIGDIVLRTKYRFLDAKQGGIAGGLDVRLPSGDKENLLGTGAVQTKLLFIASGEFSRWSPHVNVGYTFSNGDLSSSLVTFAPPPVAPGEANPATTNQINNANGDLLGGSLSLPNEFNYVFGTDFVAHPLLTISADLLGRTVLDTDESGIVSQTYQYRTANSGSLLTTTRNTFQTTGTGSLNLLLGIVGAKFNIPGTTLLVTGTVLFPLSDSGLRPKVTPVVGIDYSFGR